MLKRDVLNREYQPASERSEPHEPPQIGWVPGRAALHFEESRSLHVLYFAANAFLKKYLYDLDSAAGRKLTDCCLLTDWTITIDLVFS